MKVVLKNLTKVFPNRDKKKVGEDVVAVNNFNIEIPDGKLVGLLGPSIPPRPLQSWHKQLRQAVER